MNKPQALLLICLMLLTASALANGGFVPPVGYPKLPAVPTQIALLVHNDGMETLTVESAFTAKEEGTYAWLLPVPAEPTSLEAVSPGLLETLRFSVCPEVKHSTHIPFISTLFLFFAVLFLSAAIATKNDRYSEISIGLFVMWFLIIIAVPNWLGTEISPRTSILSSQTVGNYRVIVLSANDANELSKSLEDGGFEQINDEGKAVLQDYIERGWLFVAARLNVDDGGTLRPHPIQVTFPTEQPVFPMKFTGVNGADTKVLLYVASDQQVSHPSFKTEYSGTLTGGNPLYPSGLNAIYHPGLLEALPVGSRLTCLSADMTSEQMLKEDIFLNSAINKDFRRIYYTKHASFLSAVRAILLCLCIAMPVVAVSYRANKGFGVFACFVALFISFGVGIADASQKETIENYSFVSRHSIARNYSLVYDLRNAQPKAFQDAEIMRSWLIENAHNTITGEPIREMDSPGNFTLEENEKGEVVLIIYNMQGEPRRIESDS